MLSAQLFFERDRAPSALSTPFASATMSTPPFSSATHNAFASSNTHSFAAFGSPMASQPPAQHRVAFQAAAVAGAPSALGFGFGVGSTFGGNNRVGLGSSGSSKPVPPSSTFSSGQHSEVNSPPHSFGARPASTSVATPSGPFWSPRSQASATMTSLKRRKSVSSDDSDDDGSSTGPSSSRRAGGGGAAASSSGSPRPKPARSPAESRHLIPKKMRTGFAASPALLDDLLQSLPAAAHGAVPSPSPDPSRAEGKRRQPERDAETHARAEALRALDVGEMLSWMDKASLLALLQRLMEEPGASASAAADTPSVRERILRLLPDPTLEMASVALNEAFVAAKAAIPAGSNSSSTASMRPEYVWSRVRAPLAEFAKVALRFLPFFRVADEQQQQAARFRASPSPSPSNVHATTSFAFLDCVTSHVLELEARLPAVPASMLAFPNQVAVADAGAFPLRSSNMPRPFSASIPRALRDPASPDALFTLLLPSLLDAWQAFGAHVSRAANEQGRIFGHEALALWFARLAELANGGGSVHGQHHASQHQHQDKVELQFIRQAAAHLGATLEAECGWMLGRQPTQLHQHQHPRQQSSTGINVRKRADSASKMDDAPGAGGEEEL